MIEAEHRTCCRISLFPIGSHVLTGAVFLFSVSGKRTRGGSAAAAAAQSLQSRPTLCDPPPDLTLQDVWFQVSDHIIMAIWVIKIFFV